MDFVEIKGRTCHVRNYFTCCSYFNASWGTAHLASQPSVGILSEWRTWSGPFDTDHIFIDGQALKGRMPMKRVTTDSNA